MSLLNLQAAAGDPLFVGYVVVFGAAAVACFGSITRTRRIEDPDIRRGLVALLLASGGWATAHVAFLLVPTPQLKLVSYVVGLIIGFSTVGPWLYFCSAYTGRSLHRNGTIRRLAVAVFGAVVLVKLTNPVHQLYFTTDPVSTPFPHLAVHHGLLHWLTMGLSYVLATIGYFMLVELSMQINYGTKPLLVLTGITGLPVVLDVVGFASPYFIDITYEPLGVAVFAIGIVFVYFDRFQGMSLVGRRDDPTIAVSDDGQIREYNDTARTVFPELESQKAVGTPLEATLPTVSGALRSDSAIIDRDRNGEKRYYHVTEAPFTAGQTRLGSLVTLTDVTERERYRQELERQNDRLDEFASVVSHDLRNPLNMAGDWVELTRSECDSEYLDEIEDSHDRMRALIEDLLILARQGKAVSEPEPIDIAELIGESWRTVDTGDATLTVDIDAVIAADRSRLGRLFENLFRNAVEHNQSKVHVTVGSLENGFYVEDDGSGLPADERESVFDVGYSTTSGGTGLGLHIVQEIVDAHEWEITLTDGREGGARFEITGLEKSR